MLSHKQVWAAIDGLAARFGLSASGLARKAGLDPTTFNKSKRVGADGRPRWPNTESIARILDATGASMGDFMALMTASGNLPEQRSIPLIGLAEAGAGGFFDDGGFPVGSGWEEVRFPSVGDEHAYALEVSGDSMLPLYRDGDILIVSPGASIRRGDRVVAKTFNGEVMAKVLSRRTARFVELDSLNPEHDRRVLATGEIDWIARIVWASQ
ncbi:MAG: helix-turn-helix transcriptional regulator [Rhodobiaceae bacterium]|nr:helix-turn-helix transcriptional regulator [Rhodobiaceae bacterium]MCC0015726.1 helix-turn-helix transcriptional regulator [Rhodobiaceae bacterium]MCC0053985.1 helix-turn-helix transcriptional regulator [Rhodobiaceae bacterium]